MTSQRHPLSFAGQERPRVIKYSDNLGNLQAFEMYCFLAWPASRLEKEANILPYLLWQHGLASNHSTYLYILASC